MADTDTHASSTSAVAAHGGRKKTPARRRPATHKKTTAHKKASSPARSRDTGALQSLLSGLSRRAARTGNRIAALSEEGVSSARRTLGKAGAVSKKTINRLTREWKQMDTAKRAQFVAALLGALAAASAPLVRRQLKKR